MANIGELVAIIGADVKDLKKGMKVAQKEIRKTEKTTKDSSKNMMASWKKLGLLVGAGLIAKGVLETSIEFQKLNASLVTVTGSTRAADKAFTDLKEFATTTPFQVSEVTSAFIKMKALGLDPSEAALRSYGNTASAMGKDLNQMIEAVADASTGEFERLKEFGIKASSQGDNVALTFNNVTTTIKKDAASIEGYLKDIGDTQFAGAMDKQMETIGGAVSNLEDSWDQFLVALGETGAIDLAEDAILILSESLQTFKGSLDLFKAYQEGKLGFWDFLTASPEDVQELLSNAKLVDGALEGLKETVQDLRKHKSGNFWWTSGEEAELQEAMQKLEEYKKVKTELGLIGDLSGVSVGSQEAKDIAAEQLVATSPAAVADMGGLGPSTDEELDRLMNQLENEQKIRDIETSQMMAHYDGLAELYEADAEAATKAAKMKQQVWEQTGSALINISGQMAQGMGKNAKGLQKVLETTGAGIALVNTMIGASEALKLGFPAGIPAALAVVAQGLTFVNAIGGSSSAPSSAAAGVASLDPTGGQADDLPQNGLQEAKIVIQVDGDVVDLDEWIEKKGGPAIRAAVGRGVDFGLEIESGNV